MLMQVLFSGSKSAPDVPFRFVQIQNLSRLTCKRWVDLEKTFCYIFMYRTLTYPKRHRRLPHRRLIFTDVLIAVGMRFDDRVTGKLETYAKIGRAHV